MKWRLNKMGERGKLQIKKLSLLLKSSENKETKLSRAVQCNKKPKTQSETKKGDKQKLSPNQPKIDSFFKCCSKSSMFKQLEPITNNIKNTIQHSHLLQTSDKGKKRLFDDINSTALKSLEGIEIAKHAKGENREVIHCIDLCSESEEEEIDIFIKEEEKIEETMIVSNQNGTSQLQTMYTELASSISENEKEPSCETNVSKNGKTKQILTRRLDTLFAPGSEVKNFELWHQRKSEEMALVLHQEQVIRNNLILKMPPKLFLGPSKNSVPLEATSILRTESTKLNTKPSIKPVKTTSLKECSIKKTRPCPPYKIVAGTSFTVDAFQFREIKGITHYFLSHFHADHYVGLTRTFSMPIVLSPVTAQLVRAFIPVKECFLHVIELNKPEIIEGVEVTALDANHCPGSVMFFFKLPTGKCILHTGDFRASPDMESEPIFWNNNIDLIYLDTTYITNKYNFCTQHESICKAQYMLRDFRVKHEGKKILFICGAYLIGKERFWSCIAYSNRFKVWTEDRRKMALTAMQDKNILSILCDNPTLADMHVISMGKLNYFALVEYFEPYSSHYDLCLAIRPSGWETHGKPQYRGKINIIGIEYSEHSSHNELRRFINYLRPNEVISTVAINQNKANHPLSTSEVPKAWYIYNTSPTPQRGYQTSITSYLNRKTKAAAVLMHNNESKKENYLSPLSMRNTCFCEGNTSLFMPPNTLPCYAYGYYPPCSCI